jgi:plasmid stability protein
LRDRLRVRAARHGRSMESELRAILRETVGCEPATEPHLGDAIRRRFAPFGGVELKPHPAVAVGEPQRFDK